MKKYLLGLFAVALAVGFSAFNAPSTQTTGEKWYKFIGTNPSTQATDPQFYEEISLSEMQSLCQGSAAICAIYAVPELDGNNEETGLPRLDQSLDSELLGEIGISVAGTSQPNSAFVREYVD